MSGRHGIGPVKLLGQAARAAAGRRGARLAAEVLVVALVAALAGCATAPPERFYRLPAPQPAAALPSASGPVIAVGMVALPRRGGAPLLAGIPT